MTRLFYRKCVTHYDTFTAYPVQSCRGLCEAVAEERFTDDIFLRRGSAPAICELLPGAQCSFEKSSRTGFPKLFCIQRLIQSFLICFIFGRMLCKNEYCATGIHCTKQKFFSFRAKEKSRHTDSKKCGRTFHPLASFY